jgi:hypothetical protein
MENLVSLLLTILGIYLLIGLLFALAFVFAGVKKVDPAAANAGLGFKLIILPGAMVFWPLLLKRWVQGTPPPEECSAHRRAAKS